MATAGTTPIEAERSGHIYLQIYVLSPYVHSAYPCVWLYDVTDHQWSMCLECAFPLSAYASWRDSHSLLTTMMTDCFTWWWSKARAIMSLGIWLFSKYNFKDLFPLCCIILNTIFQTPKLKDVIAHMSLTAFELYKWKLNRPLQPLAEYAEVFSYLFLTVCRYVCMGIGCPHVPMSAEWGCSIHAGV